jgi:hypothetical protein
MSESCLLAVLSQIVFALSFFPYIICFSVRKSIQAFKGSWLSISVVSSWFGLSIFIFFQSLDIHAACTRSDHVYTPSVSIQHVFTRVLFE